MYVYLCRLDPRAQNFTVFLVSQVVVQVANTSNFICEHQGFCHPNCYERQRRSCSRLIMAIQRIYDSQPGDDARDSRGGSAGRAGVAGGEGPGAEDGGRNDDFHSLFRDKLKRRVSALLTFSLSYLAAVL